MSTLIGMVVSATALLAFLGTATMFVLRGKQQARVERLEKQADDLRNDVADRDRRISFLEHENDTKTEQIHHLEAQILSLENLKLSEAYLSAMDAKLQSHGSRMAADHERIFQELTVIRNQNRDMLALLADQRRNQR